MNHGAIVAAAVVFMDYDWLRAVDHCLWINDRAHLLVGLHVNGLRRAVDDWAFIVNRSGCDIGWRRVDRGSRLVAPIKSSAVAEGEAPRIGVGGCGECRGECGEDKEFFHRVGWWLKVQGKCMDREKRRQIGGIENQCFKYMFSPLKAGFLPLTL